MNIGRTQITYRGPVLGCPHLRASELNQMKREAWAVVGHYWQRTMREKHFTRAGAQEYGYKPRAGETGNERKNFWTSYAGRKLKRFHTQDPLVLTGELRDLSKIYRLDITATTTKSRLRIVLPMAQKANLRNPKSQINMNLELTTVSTAEADELVKRFDYAFSEQIARRSGDVSVVSFFHN